MSANQPSQTVYRLILKRRPYSYNKSSEIKKSGFRESVKKGYPNLAPMDGDLYGKVYWFCNVSPSDQGKQSDADNISKPIWDCLKGLAFHDDQQVKLRIAGRIDGPEGIERLDFTNLGIRYQMELISAILSENHVLYIEYGLVEPSMFRFYE